MKIIGLAVAVLVLPHACEAAFKLPSSPMPEKVSLPSFSIGTPVALHVPSMMPKGVRLPSHPKEIPLGPSRLPSVSLPLPSTTILLADGSQVPAGEQTRPSEEKLDRVFDNSRQRSPAPARRGERRYYPIPESDLLEEIGVR